MAQEDVKIRKKEFKTGVDIGFKEAWKSIKEGNSLYREGKGTYGLARDHFLFAHQYNPENAALNYKIGVCYLFTEDKYRAIDYLYTAYELDEQISSDINLLLGRAYHLVLEFDLAIQYYRAHQETLKEKDAELYSGILSKRIAECQNGKDLTQKPLRVIIQDLGEEVNSIYDDYNPVFAFGDTAMFFTSRRPYEKSKRNPVDNKYNEDIYLSAHEGEEFMPAVRLDKPFNSEFNDALVGKSAEGDRLIIYKGNEDKGAILISSLNKKKSKWNKPKGLPKKLVSKDGETSATLSADGKEMFYISRNQKLSKGGKDILVSVQNDRGKWQDPFSIGEMLNTKYDEEGVFLAPDGKTLFFASEGHNSMGGFDIFKSTRSETGEWSAPVNLGYPINTPDDELFYITDQSGVYGYYSAIREGGLGAKDLFKIIYLGSEKELLTSTKDQLVAGLPGKKKGFLTPPVLSSLDTSFIVTGRVLDTVGGETPVLAKLTFMDPEGEVADVNVVSGEAGQYLARLPESKFYAVEINATGYLYFLDIVDLMGQPADEKLEQDFFMKKIEVGTKVVLDNIYFELGKAVLRPESFDALDQVFRFLENNPGMKLEISGHTDNTGSLRINQRLSRDRAKAVVDYLTERGISESMLVYKGYADTQPVAPNDTSEGRERNRRVEFKVLSKQ